MEGGHEEVDELALEPLLEQAVGDELGHVVLAVPGPSVEGEDQSLPRKLTTEMRPKG